MQVEPESTPWRRQCCVVLAWWMEDYIYIHRTPSLRPEIQLPQHNNNRLISATQGDPDGIILRTFLTTHEGQQIEPAMNKCDVPSTEDFAPSARLC
jgi:hypothetical protein